jgi:hypothetical protein
MPGKMARSDPRPSVRVTRGAGSGQRLSVLQEGRENANIDAGLGFIWRISAKTRELGFAAMVLGLLSHIQQWYWYFWSVRNNGCKAKVKRSSFRCVI